MIYVGDDWAAAHHDVYLCDGAGARLGGRRFPEGIEGIPEGIEGISAFHELVAGLVDDPGEVVVGIETDRGLWVQALIEAGDTVYAINPKAASRYRDRHTLSAAKSDRGDAKMLAELVRTDRHNHRPVAGDSDLGEGVKVLARAHQNLIRDRAPTVGTRPRAHGWGQIKPSHWGQMRLTFPVVADFKGPGRHRAAYELALA